MASHAEGVQAVSITPALSLLHGHRSIVLLPIFHDPDGFGTSAESSGGRGRHGRLVYFTQHCPQSGCFLANRCRSSLQQSDGCAYRCAEGKIYGFFYIPKGLSAEAQSQRQPKISFYTNYSYLIAGSLLFRDMKMMGELTAGSAARSVLYAKGATEDQAMGFLQPIVIDTHPLNNPWLNYSVYLCNTLIPGVLMLLIFMVTVYSIGVEIKDRTAREWLRMSNNSIYIALAGKLLPHTVVFFIMGIFYNVYLYGFLHFPCNSGIFPMIFATLCLVLASQCCGIVMIGTLPTLRLGLSFASLWGVISFSISGFSFPVMAMNPVLQALSNLFPLRHYFLIYVDQALNGYSMAYSWSNYMALLIFMMLPFFVVHRLKEALVYYKYIP